VAPARRVGGTLVELHLANLAEGADSEAQAYLSELLDLHQALDWAAAGPYLARLVGWEDDGAARAFVHCEKRLVEGSIGVHEGLGDPSYPYAVGVTATSAPPESGWGAPGAVSLHEHKRNRGAAERPRAREGTVWRTARAGPYPVGPVTRPTFAPPGVPYYPALGAGKTLSWGCVTPRPYHGYLLIAYTDEYLSVGTHTQEPVAGVRLHTRLGTHTRKYSCDIKKRVSLVYAKADSSANQRAAELRTSSLSGQAIRSKLGL